jgi:CBS domain containing-hemolysin-like protein
VSQSGYSRFPVFEDNVDNIIGMVRASPCLSS